ncbi:MAG: hypothetical protein OXI54_16000 [Chloroflexota bacterium]|nr:hypothetical protein [Chloroflexota bacterium]
MQRMNGAPRTNAAILATLFTVAAGISACDRIAPDTSLPPLPTPLSSSEFSGVELGSQGVLTHIYGDNAIGKGDDGELWLTNILTGEARQITDDGHYKWNAVLSGTHAAWIVEGEEIRLTGEGGGSKNTADVFVMDLPTGEPRRITDVRANRNHLHISGYRLVWSDNRNELQEPRERYDIYAYDLSNDREIPIVVAPGNQQHPAIHGDIVVWSDNRNSPQLGTRAEGCHNRPDRQCDIYSHNLATGEERLLAQTGNNNGSPSVHGDLVVWQQYLEGGGSIIVMLDLDTGQQLNVGFGGHSYTRPLISANHVVWSVKEACDVRGFLGNRSDTGAFHYRLDTGDVRRLSSYVEAEVLLHDNVAVVTEGCQTGYRHYAVFLD